MKKIGELRDLHCERAQGYLWSPALEADATERWIGSRRSDPAFDRSAQSVSYEGETAEQRIARRKRLWTPVELLES